MARVGGINGSVTSGLNHKLDLAAFDIDVAQVVEEDTSYSDTAESHVGNGLPGYRATARGFLKSGVTASAPGFAAMAATGATVTFQLDTGCTMAGTFVAERCSISHSKKSAAVPMTLQLVGKGALTETWNTGS